MEPAEPTADAPVDDDDDILSFMQHRQHSPNTAVGEIDRYLPVTTDESVMSFWEDNSKNAEQFQDCIGYTRSTTVFQLLQLRWKEYSALLVTL